MTDVRALGERSQAMIDALASITAEPGKLTRLYLTPEHKRAAHLVGDWMRGAGMAVRMDAAGTMHGLLAAGGARKRLLIGSHIDTVIDAGRYDGNLGVVAGIIAVEEIRKRGIGIAVRPGGARLRRRGGGAVPQDVVGLLHDCGRARAGDARSHRRRRRQDRRCAPAVRG